MLNLSSVIVHKKAGQDIPTGYLKEMLKNNTSLIIIFAAKDGKFHPQVQTTVPSAEDFEKHISPEMKEHEVMLFLAQSNEEIAKDHYQPFVLLTNTDDEPILCAYMEGSFVKKEGKNANEMIPAHEAADLLREKIKDLYETCEEDTDKLFKLLDKTSMRKDLEAIYGLRGVVLLTSNEGHSLRVSSAGKEFDWGYVSKSYEYAEKKAEEPKAAPAKKKGFSLFKDDDEEPAKEMPEKVPVDTPEKESTVVDKGLTVDDINKQTATDTKVPRMLRVPDRIWNTPDFKQRKNKVKGWYHKYAGKSFAGRWEQRPSFPETALARPLEGEDAKDSFILPSAKEVAEKTGAATAVEKDKIEPKEVDKYVLSAKAKEDIGEFLKGMDTDKRVIRDPKTILEAEDKYPSFCEQSGIYLEDTFNWTVDEFETLGLKSLEGLALLTLEYRAKLFSGLKMEDLVDTSGDKKDSVETEQVEDIQPEPEKKVAAGGKGYSLFK